MSTFSFAKALEYLSRGVPVTRAAWNGWTKPDLMETDFPGSEIYVMRLIISANDPIITETDRQATDWMVV